MNDDPEMSDKCMVENDEETNPDGEGAAEVSPAFGGSVSSLSSFSSVQRMLASIEFSAIQTAQRAIKDSQSFEEIVETQEAIARTFARALDFSRIAATHKALMDTSRTSQDMAARWADTLAESIDLSELIRATSSSATLDSSARTSTAFNEWVREQTEFYSRIANATTFKLPTIDTSGLVAALDRWIPVNLRGVLGLDVVATVALEEGLPLSWVPRAELVVLLIEADGSDARVALLTEHRDDVLDDCENALGAIENEWAVQCRGAIAAMRAGYDGPAQSHASNIIDSVVLGLHGRSGRKHAVERAQGGLDDLPLELAAENLTLRPLFRAFTTWYPNTGIDPPDHFARHSTSHAVGQPGVFAPISALIAVMLATSLTVQYSSYDVRSPTS